MAILHTSCLRLRQQYCTLCKRVSNRLPFYRYMPKIVQIYRVYKPARDDSPFALYPLSAYLMNIRYHAGFLLFNRCGTFDECLKTQCLLHCLGLFVLALGSKEQSSGATLYNHEVHRSASLKFHLCIVFSDYRIGLAW